ncbi:TPA: 26S proteasome complex subunit SEM1 [Trebouxia sp. C0006]
MPEKKADVSKPQQPVKPMEDDDEFEEFDVEGWKEEDEDPAKAELWEADWDDTSVSDNFAQQLRTELQSHAKK